MYIFMIMMISVFLTSSSPLTSALMMLLMTFTLSVMMFFYKTMSLMAFLMFLIFLGGVMVLFTYMCSLAPNEKFNPTKKTLALMITMWTMHVTMVSIYGATPIPQSKSNFYLMKLFCVSNEPVYFMLFFYLLTTLFTCVALSKKKDGAIRMKTN